MPLRNATEISNRVAKTQLAIRKTINSEGYNPRSWTAKMRRARRIYQKASVSTMKCAPCYGTERGSAGYFREIPRLFLS